ncbi:hypothetical protein C5Y96_25950 [Blastopirellula marina]|uniref:Uncharacterized protein n=1 Tax=Blastopirellula marina TaxID=124 RepID=A0A2S8EZJ5_9BACT|nr:MULTISPECIES: tetratricopeptide repeat protein [Pirellulaceae]PQO25339.1 hypothetical protein C5Y96_25950 [Blastopirellula marina]RCS41772.1 tetratricopeptide repeat protein [Bremerella cremea]
MFGNLARNQRAQWYAVALLIAVATVAVYHRTFQYPFHLDSAAHVLNYPTFDEFAWKNIHLRSRGLVDFTWTLQRSWGGDAPLGYHLVNLIIHVAASITLFGFLQVTLLQPRVSEGIRRHAFLLSGIIALVWAVHPLQTQSVTYIVQRYESLMGLFFLLSILCFAVGHNSKNMVFWRLACVAFGFAAVSCKEVAVVLPLVILWYDRALLSESWKSLFRRNWFVYLGLMASWILIVHFFDLPPEHFQHYGVAVVNETVITEGGTERRTVGPTEYLYSQTKVIPFYLWLSVIPNGQSLDHGWRATFSLVDALLPGLFILSLIGLTIWATFRNPLLGFWGGWFFLILAPTSSFLPIQDIAFEHRMYLPLAGVLSVLVLGGYQAISYGIGQQDAAGTDVLGRVVLGIGVVAVLGYGVCTIARNEVYRSSNAMWQDVIAKNPQHFRGYSQLANVYLKEGDIEKATPLLTKAIELYPTVGFTKAHGDLFYEQGLEAIAKGDENLARQYFEIAIRGNPRDDRICVAIAQLEQTQNPERAMAFLRRAVELNPNNSEAYNRLASIVQHYDRPTAISLFQKAIQVAPENVHAHNNLANAYAHQKQWSDAIRHYKAALSLEPGMQAAAKNLAIVQEMQKASEGAAGRN